MIRERSFVPVDGRTDSGRGWNLGGWGFVGALMGVAGVVGASVAFLERQGVEAANARAEAEFCAGRTERGRQAVGCD